MSLPKFLTDLDPNVYMRDDYLVVDFEVDTSHGDYGNPIHPANQLLLAAYKKAGQPTRAVWDNELGHAELHAEVGKAGFVVAHSGKYELGWFKRMDIDLHNVLLFDTKIAEYVLLGNLAAGAKKLGMPPMSTSLDMCCRRRGLPIKDPVVDTMIGHGINPVLIPRPWLEGRCRQDVETTEQVFLDQRRQLKATGRLPVLYTRCLLTPVLVEIEAEGMAIDGDAVMLEYAKYIKQLGELETRMTAMTGGINFRSAPQMAKFLYSPDGMGFKELTDRRGNPKRNAPHKQFPAGMPKTDNDTLDKLTGKTKRQKEFLELRSELGRVSALLSKNLEFFRGVVEEKEGTFHGQVNQTDTATHRTASRGIPLTFRNQLDDGGKPRTRSVQFQNLPRGFKKFIRAKRAGWLIGDADGSQLEFRCAVQLGRDTQGVADIEDPTFDAHIITASVLNNLSYDEVRAEKQQAATEDRDDLRQLAKPDTYKPLYGGKYGTPDQERYYAYFRERYAGIARMQEQWVEHAVRNHILRTPWGLIYFWPTAKRSSSGHVNVESAVDNYPIQAFATAEIVPIAVVYLWHRIREAGLDDKIKIVNMVHDDAPCEIHPDAAEAFTELSKQCFTRDVYGYLEKVYGYDFDLVPLGVGIKIGDRWGAGKEHAFNIYKDGREVQVK